MALCYSTHQRAGEGVEAGIFRVDDALHRRLEDTVRPLRQTTAAGRGMSATAMITGKGRTGGGLVRDASLHRVTASDPA